MGAGLGQVAYHEAGKITGSASGGTPNAEEIKAKTIRIIEAQTPKAISEEFSRAKAEAVLFRGRREVVDAVSCVAIDGYKIVGEKKAMSVSKSMLSTMTWLPDGATRFK